VSAAVCQGCVSTVMQGNLAGGSQQWDIIPTFAFQMSYVLWLYIFSKLLVGRLIVIYDGVKHSIGRNGKESGL
jgi:hypothetical protein